MESLLTGVRWDPPTEGWVVKTISKNLWRVTPDLEFDDLYQEAALVYERCYQRYKVANLMPVFMASFINEINTLALKRTSRRSREVVSSQISDEISVIEQAEMHELFDGTDFKILLQEDPEIRELFDKLFGEGMVFRKKVRRKRKGRMVQRQTTNGFICEILGKDVNEVDLTARISRKLGVVL